MRNAGWLPTYIRSESAKSKRLIGVSERDYPNLNPTRGVVNRRAFNAHQYVRTLMRDLCPDEFPNRIELHTDQVWRDGEFMIERAERHPETRGKRR